MKNIQMIDSAVNCTFSVFQVDDDLFHQIFPGEGQDVEFIEDVVKRVGDRLAGTLVSQLSVFRIDKKHAIGIHGTLFFGMSKLKPYYPNKAEADLDQRQFGP